MTTLSQESARLDRRERQGLEQILDPIRHDLRAVEEHLADRLWGVKDAGIRELIEFLLGSPGKRIRPALVLLSPRAAVNGADGCPAPGHIPLAVAAAVELIHMASQILDDCRDLLSDEEDLGKKPGQDLLAGDVTLPLLYGIRHCHLRGGRQLPPAPGAIEQGELTFIGDAFRSSQAPVKIRRLVESYLRQAGIQLEAVHDSDFRKSLHGLAGYIAVSMSDILKR